MSGATLPLAPRPAGRYEACRQDGNTLHVSGQVPWVGDTLHAVGRLGETIDSTLGADCAYQAALNSLAIAAEACGDLTTVSAVTMRVYLASTPDFVDHVSVADGASRALHDVLGDRGRHARTTVGVIALPLGSPLEVEISYSTTQEGNAT